MTYSPGMLHEQVTVAARTTAQQSRFGLDGGGVAYQTVGTFFAAVDWKRGLKEMREGALDGYDIIMVRMYWNASVTRECLVQYDGVWYQIESFHRCFYDNTIQITARELANQNITITD